MSAFSLYRSTVMHRRYFPKSYKFNYSVFSFLIDIDRLEKEQNTLFISHNRFNLFSVYDKDHGARDGSKWRDWIDSLLDKENLSQAKSQIRLLCFPRILGYAFNPISLWYCYGDDQKLYAIICEVSNTFGEHHHYLLQNNGLPYGNEILAEKKKNFHVSPFINMHAEYRFKFNQPDDDLKIIINEYQQNELMLTASQIGKKIPLTNKNLLKQFFSLPLMTMKIMLMIHWQALNIWLRGGRYHKKPPTPREDYS